MAHIVSFSVGGLAGNERIYSQKLNRDVNVFFGSNGSGKTSLLKLLHSSMSLNPSFLDNVPFATATIKVYSVFFKQVFTERLKKQKKKPAQYAPAIYHPDVASPAYEQVRVLQANYRGASQMRWNVQPKDVKTSGGWQHEYLPISRLYSNIALPSTARQTTYSEEELDLRYAESLQAIWSSYSADVSKIVREAQEMGLAKILRAVLSKSRARKQPARAMEAASAYRRVSAFLERQPGVKANLGSTSTFVRRYSEDQHLQSVVADIDEVEQKIEVATQPREQLRKFIESMFIGNKVMKFGDKGIEVEVGKIPIGLPTLSSGEKQLLLILVATLRAGSNAILIDEPELSMHVDWQKVLIKTMTQLNPEAQIIVATHSPEIMADLPDDKIFRI